MLITNTLSLPQNVFYQLLITSVISAISELSFANALKMDKVCSFWLRDKELHNIAGKTMFPKQAVAMYTTNE